MKLKITLVLWAFALSSCQTSRPTSITSPFQQVNLAPERSRAQYESTGSRSMVSSQGLQSSQAALEVLQKGGNLFDAFTALSFAIGVERPHSTGIGGGGFALFRKAGSADVVAFDFRETAPQKAHEKMFVDESGKAIAEKSLTGGLAVAVPGHVAGVLEMHKKHGILSLSVVMAPAIRMAEEGIVVYPALHRAMKLEKERLNRFADSRKIFLNPEGEPWPVGHRLIQKDLAGTLRRIADKGAKEFYQGETARRIVSTVSKHQGVMSGEDLKSYQSKWRKPVRGTYKNFEIFSQPPPSSGGVHVIQILNTLENDSLKSKGPQSAESIHLTASAMQRAFVDRARYMGDPDFVEVPVERLISKDYARQVRAVISSGKAWTAGELEAKEESPDTTHFSLMDSQGNAIASTQTINGFFGSAMVAEGTGVVLNNEMDDFAALVGGSNLFGAVGGKNNLVQPRKRPLSSMSPTLVMKDGEPWMVVGTPSGTRIITCVALTLLNSLEYELPLWQSVSLTRYHQQWKPDELQMESPLPSNQILGDLEKLGWKIQEKDPGCRIQAIQKEGSVLRGVSDPREEGASLGL